MAAVKSNPTKQFVLILVFAGVFAGTILCSKFLSGPHAGGIDQPSRDAALARYGFVLQEVSKECGIDFKHESPAKLDPKSIESVLFTKPFHLDYFSVGLIANGDRLISAYESQFSGTILGSGNITATGTVQNLSASIKGSGNLNLQSVQARAARVSIAGSGDATVNASDELSASIAGSGDIRYAGDPPRVEKNVAGSGSIRKI